MIVSFNFPTALDVVSVTMTTTSIIDPKPMNMITRTNQNVKFLLKCNFATTN